MPRVLFLADQFADSTRTEGEKHPGGAELTDATAIEACPWPIECAPAKDFDPARLDGFDVHVIGNFESAAPDLLRALAERGRHVLFEHDVRICQWNGNFPSAWEKLHHHAQWCVCPHPRFGPLYESAMGTIFLTHRQLGVYRANPFFEPQRTAVLGSSLMNDAFFERVERARENPTERDIDWAVVHSRNAIKGTENALAYCSERGVEPFVIQNLEPEEVLDVLERTRRFVYLPIGLEPAGRMLLEARFLGAEVVSNPNAGVAGESWWNLQDGQALEVLRDAPYRFWRIIEAWMSQESQPAQSRPVMPLAKVVQPVTNAALRTLEAVVPGWPLRRLSKRVERRVEEAGDVSRPGRHDLAESDSQLN
ncbi:MAG: hypothetical protein ACLFVJ_03715 [Persicimonas sp.]